MECKHPVLYDGEKGLYCHICGALIKPKPQDDKQEGHEEKPAEAAKKPVKRRAKKEGD